MSKRDGELLLPISQVRAARKWTLAGAGPSRELGVDPRNRIFERPRARHFRVGFREMPKTRRRQRSADSAGHRRESDDCCERGHPALAE